MSSLIGAPLKKAKSSMETMFAELLSQVTTPCKVVVGIDFGTAYSGVAIAYSATPGDVACGAPSSYEGMPKCPTKLLRLGKDTWRFGVDAEKTYYEKLQEHAEDPTLTVDFEYFERFKMVLKDQTTGYDTLTAFSHSGAAHSLMDLVKVSLQQLSTYAINKITAGYGGEMEIDFDNDVQWVLTVPAIWTEFGKSFMRKAAYLAGIIKDEHSSLLSIAFEPECAALAVHSGASEHGLLGPDSAFLVLDCGGGTVDITGYKVVTVSPLSMESIISPVGGAWGGEYVNQEFESFLEKFFTTARLDDLKKRYPENYFDIVREFKLVKEGLTMSDGGGGWDPTLSFKFDSIKEALNVLGEMATAAAAATATAAPFPTMEELIGAFNDTVSDSNSHVTSKRSSPRLPLPLMLSFFNDGLSKTTSLVDDLLVKNHAISTVIIVGGYGGSDVLRHFVTTQLNRTHPTVKVITPDTKPKPQGAIAHGAALHGMFNCGPRGISSVKGSGIIRSRISPYTYGLGISLLVQSPEFPWVPSDASYPVFGVFSTFVKAGDSIEQGHIVTKPFVPSVLNQKVVNFPILKTESTVPRFAADTGVVVLAAIDLACPAGKDGKQHLECTFRFDGTEITVEVKNALGEVKSQFLTYGS